MPRILITGSTEGLGRAAAESLLDEGHEVVVHARTTERLAAVRDLLDRGAASVIGDLTRLDETLGLADQANALGRFDAVIHNAGVFEGPAVLPVNVVAPYALTTRMLRPPRLIYLSSGLHRDGRPRLDGADWSGSRETLSYSDSKLFVTALMAAVARRWHDTAAHAVDPGWVPTRMGGPNAPGDLRLGHTTQTWLAVTEDPEARIGGCYWHHRRIVDPHPSVHDEGFQDALLGALGEYTGIEFAAS
ncbi:MAG: SDR family NAD(P)-dependent oxidoreductase [Leucobacter sp.]